MVVVPFLARSRNGVAVFRRPVRQGFHQVRQAVARRRELVLDLRWDRWVHSSGDKPIPFQPADREGQHPLRDAGDGALQLPETAYSLR